MLFLFAATKAAETQTLATWITGKVRERKALKTPENGQKGKVKPHRVGGASVVLDDCVIVLFAVAVEQSFDLHLPERLAC